MSDSKMTNNYGIYSPAERAQIDDSVVQALDAAVLFEADAEGKIRAKLQEFAAELQTITIFKDVSQ